MRVIPAVDLREGACVQLVGGDYADERVRLPDPVAVAARWREAGFRELHVVDLDAATGAGDQSSLLERLVRETGLPVQAGGGVRDRGRIARLLGAGAARVVVGTAAFERPHEFAEWAAEFPGRLVVAADVRGLDVVTHGWSAGTGLPITLALTALAALPLAGVLVTAVHREGRLQGPDLPLLDLVRPLCPFPLIASGGITTMQDLTALAALGADAAVLGMALYTGALDARAAAGMSS